MNYKKVNNAGIDYKKLFLSRAADDELKAFLLDLMTWMSFNLKGWKILWIFLRNLFVFLNELKMIIVDEIFRDFYW